MNYRVIYSNIGRQAQYCSSKEEGRTIIEEVGCSSGKIRLQRRVGDSWKTIETWKRVVEPTRK